MHGTAAGSLPCSKHKRFEIKRIFSVAAARLTFPHIRMSTRKRNFSFRTGPRTLNELSPTEFENLLYDLLIARGMVNVVWRTPGADGGRDIEGESIQIDASNSQDFTKWYIECKRYSGSVDWPTIYPKLAYADAANAEYLLLCTTSKFTPQAISCCKQWNKARRFPKLRLWAGHDLATQLTIHTDLKFKYGLLDSPAVPGKSIVSLALALSKTIGTYYSASAQRDILPNRMLRAAFALALLLQQRMEDIERFGAITIRPLDATAALAVDATFTGTPHGLDELGFTAFCSYLSALTKTHLRISFQGIGSYTITGDDNFTDVLNRYREPFAAISLWGDFEFSFSSTEVMVRQR